MKVWVNDIVDLHFIRVKCVVLHWTNHQRRKHLYSYCTMADTLDHINKTPTCVELKLLKSCLKLTGAKQLLFGQSNLQHFFLSEVSPLDPWVAKTYTFYTFRWSYICEDSPLFQSLISNLFMHQNSIPQTNYSTRLQY